MLIPFSKPYFDEREEQAVLEVLRSGWLTTGPKVKEFEERFAEYVGAKHAVAVNSCTSALFLALKRLNSLETYVFVPSLTFSASASTIVHADFVPSFVDVDDDLVARKFTNQPLMAVDLTGIDVGIDSERTIHDCAHRVDREMCKNKFGTFCFSFYPTKNLASAEGGMICTNDDKDAEWFRLARSHGQTKSNYDRYAVGGSNHWEYSIEFPGWKMNMTDIQAAIGLVQLEKLDEINAKRQHIIERYNEAFGLNRQGLHLYPIEVDNRSEFIQKMYEAGISCSVHFLPLHLMPAYKDYPKDDLTNTERLGKRLVSLPLYPSMTDEEVGYVIRKTREYL